MRFGLTALTILVLGIGCAGRPARVESTIPAMPKSETKKSTPRPMRTEIVRKATPVVAPVKVAVAAPAPVKVAVAKKVEAKHETKKAPKAQPIMAGFFSMPMHTSKPRPWHNAQLPSDVNRDGQVTEADKAAVFAELKSRGPEALEGKPGKNANLIDADGNGLLTVEDALYVMADLGEN